MRVFLTRALLVAVAALGVPAIIEAQARPTPEQARELLRTRPDLVQQLRRRLTESGLTPEQIRARLRAEGYPEDILDPYLPGSRTQPGGARGDSATAAAGALGLLNAEELAADSVGFRDDSLLGDPAAMSARARRDSLESLDLYDLPRTDPALAARRRQLDVPLATDTSKYPPAVAKLNPDSGYIIFGLDLFRSENAQRFQPNNAGPVDPSYRLGPGDQLVLILTGDVEESYALDVNREGFVVIPRVGQLYVANLTVGQLEDLLYSRLGRAYSGIQRGSGATTRFSLSVARVRAVSITVVGDVVRPGNYRVSSAGTALTALFAAGGPSPDGSLRRVVVRRGSRVVDTLDVYGYLLRGDPTNDARLENGDVVFVPTHGPRVRVVGEVVRPSTYELKPGESLVDVVRAAGGFTPQADLRRLQIERILPPAERSAAGGDRVLVDVASPTLARGAAPAFALQPGDVVRVFGTPARIVRRVNVRGPVWRPGLVAIEPGMRVGDVLRRAGGLRPDAYLGTILVTRLQSDSSRQQLRVSARDTSGTVVDDIPVDTDDDIQVFSLADFRARRYVTVSGAVKRPGRYNYREGMTMRDLVLLAQGLEESALLTEAEIARLPENRAGGVTARTERVPLDSSYVFERDAEGRYVGPPGLPARSGPAPELVLNAYDNVLVLRQPEWELQRTVIVTGEVRFPGRYSLRRRDEKLSDVLARAGGLTNRAYPEGVVFVRGGETNAGGARQIGRIGIDLPRALRAPGRRDNFVLLDGDSIHIPQYSPVVVVQGEVNAPVAVPFVPGQNIRYYINASGGPRPSGDLHRAYVTQPNGRVESTRNVPIFPDVVPVPRAGSTIIVPPKDRSPIDLSRVQALSTILTALTSVATVIALVRQ